MPYGWSGGGGRTSHRFMGSRTGALYSLELGLAEHFMHESSDCAPRCRVTVAYGSGGADCIFIIGSCLGRIDWVTSAYSD